MKVGLEFDAPETALRALAVVKSLGYLDVQTYAPFALADDDAHASRGSVAVSLLSAGGALTGLVAAYMWQWYANVASYPLNIGGRPAHAIPAFVPATFETVCLMGTIGVFAAFLLTERLPRLWQPIFEIDGFERCSIDRYWLMLDVRHSDSIDKVKRDLVGLHPLRMVVAQDEG